MYEPLSELQQRKEKDQFKMFVRFIIRVVIGLIISNLNKSFEMKVKHKKKKDLIKICTADLFPKMMSPLLPI